MNAIVRIALDKPYTVAVAAILIAIFGVLSAISMPTDIFPRINIPVLSCIWQYTGLMPQDMERRIVNISERVATTTVKGIEHIESISLLGTGLVKVFLHQDADVAESLSELTAGSQAILKQMPPGMTPPFISSFSATDVPVMQISVSSKSLSETELFDFVNNFIRTQLATVHGASMPYPYGGSTRQVVVDLDPEKMAARGISATDVSEAINSQNLIMPAGTAKMGTSEYYIALNSSPETVAALNMVPVKQSGNSTILMRDIGFVHDGLAVQTNIVNENGQRAILINILRLGGASTVDVVNRVKELLPSIRNILPDGVDLKILTDQSIFVTEAIADVLKEGATAAALTALLMLLLLGDWRSTVIVSVSIPLSVLCGLVVLHLSGQTVNTLTLSGFALAVGMLVDDATVVVENIHRHLVLLRDVHMESAVAKLRKAILEASAEIATPSLVSTVAICLVFAPTWLLTEPAKSLFVPMSLAVVASMMASYFLSRTVVPVMARYMLSAKGHHRPMELASNRVAVAFWRVQAAVEARFEAIRRVYEAGMRQVFANRQFVVASLMFFMLTSLVLLPFLGRDFFPTVDAGAVRLHVSAPRGTRLEETEATIKQVEREIRKLVPPEDFEAIADNIGVPISGINLSTSDTVDYTAADGEIWITLAHSHRHSSSYYQRVFRENLPKLFPQCEFFFQPPDISTQILNAGIPAPIDVQVRGLDLAKSFELATKIEERIKKIPGAVDVHLKQAMNGPLIKVDVDRQKAAQVGLAQRDVAGSVLVSLSSSFQTAPNFWVNPKNGVNYNIAVQTPQRDITSLNDLATTNVTSKSTAGAQQQLLGNLATFSRGTVPTLISHYNGQPVVDILASVDGTDLGTVAAQVNAIVAEEKKSLPKGLFLDIRGQVSSMEKAYQGLMSGIAFALVLVYLLLVVNFQSWKDPMIILMAIPGALCGIVWALYLTQTPFSIPALMGSIMTIGVASANSILVVSFARERLAAGVTPERAAIEAGITRFRPVVMTALAMIVGMLPMAIGSGAGGAQNAPLGRAVVGGLAVATIFTLVWVPLVFSFLHRKDRAPQHAVAENAQDEITEPRVL